MCVLCVCAFVCVCAVVHYTVKLVTVRRAQDIFYIAIIRVAKKAAIYWSVQSILGDQVCVSVYMW